MRKSKLFLAETVAPLRKAEGGNERVDATGANEKIVVSTARHAISRCRIRILTGLCPKVAVVRSTTRPKLAA